MCQEHDTISITKYDEMHTISKSVLNLICEINEAERSYTFGFVEGLSVSCDVRGVCNFISGYAFI